MKNRRPARSRTFHSCSPEKSERVADYHHAWLAALLDAATAKPPKKINIPVLVMHSEDDQIVSYQAPYLCGGSSTVDDYEDIS